MSVPVVCVVIPAYNEESFIADVIRRIPAFVSSIVVVDDASSDSTVEEVKALSDPRVRLIQHETNTGVGGAVISGYRFALETNADIVVKIDGDGQMKPEEIFQPHPTDSKKAGGL